MPLMPSKERVTRVLARQQPDRVPIYDRFWFEVQVDTQNTLPRGTHEEIRREARRLVDVYGTPQGGFIASDCRDAEAIGVTHDRRLVMFEAFAEKGGYPGYKEILAWADRPRTGHSWGRQTVRPDADG